MKRKILGVLGVIFLSAVLLTGANVQPVFAADDYSCNASRPLGLKPWYDGLCEKNENRIVKPTEKTDEIEKGGMSIATFAWIAILNITFDISLVVGYIALAMFIYGGFKYIMSQGEPQNMTRAKKTLTTAVIGTVIAMGASVIVNTLTAALGINMNGGWKQNDFTRDTLDNIFIWVYSISGLVAVIFIIKYGLDMMMARGNQTAVQQAIRGIIAAAAGLIIVIFAAVITSFVIGSIGGTL